MMLPHTQILSLPSNSFHIIIIIIIVIVLSPINLANLLLSSFSILLTSSPPPPVPLYSSAFLFPNFLLQEEPYFAVQLPQVLFQFGRGKIMTNCVIQNASQTWEEMRSSVTVSVSISDKRDTVVCPKPRRLGLINTIDNEPTRPLRWQMSHQSDFYDSKAGNELLDIILSRGGYTMEQTCSQAASPPPFFCGSPPSRVSNPLIQDARFGSEVAPISPRSIPIAAGMSISPSSSARKGACARANFGNKPVVRVEGFDCLDRDSRNCSIPTMA